jgi:TRAP-type C4-dicarboxylate transport system permease small subunit
MGEGATNGGQRAAWGEPLVRLNAAWTKLESRLCAAVLMTEIFALCVWISLKGLSSESGGGNIAGVVYRIALTATVLGLVVHKATKARLAAAQHGAAVSAAVVIGGILGTQWASLGVSYASNVLNWMQTASLLTLVGGLRGVATRLTLWLALLGASLATAQGKHINVDVVMRFLTPKLRGPVATLGWTVAAVMCLAGVWGFFDYIAIDGFKTPKDMPCEGTPDTTCDTPPGVKFEHVKHELGNDLFLARRQITLDFKSLPHVIRGERYDQYLHAPEWNAWMNDADWTTHFPADDVKPLMMAEDSKDARLPAVIEPGGEARDLLVKEANFIFPFGLLMIALRFLLRALLVVSGQVVVDPDAAHAEEDVEERHAHDDKEAA